MSDVWRSASVRRGSAVFVGAAIGAAGRLALVEGVVALGSWALVGTFIVNLFGAFALGNVVGRRTIVPMPATAFAFLAIGLLGSFTTFSSFAFEVFDLLADTRVGMAAAYATGSIVMGLVVARAGVVLGERR